MRACEQKGAQSCNGVVNRIEYFAKKSPTLETACVTGVVIFVKVC